MSGSLTLVDFLAGQVTFNAFLPSGQGKSSSKIILLRWARFGPRWAKYKSCFPKRAFWWFFELLSWVWKYQYTQTCLFDMCCIRRNKMLVSLRGVRINSVLSFFFLEQVSSDLLHVWVLVCCVFNFAVDCIWDYCPVVLFSSLCRGMTHKIHVNWAMKAVPRIHNLVQKLLKIVPVRCLSSRFGTRYDPFPCPTLVSFVQSWAEMIQPVFNVVFWGRVKKEVFVMSSIIVRLRASAVTSIFLNIFVQDCRIDLVCVTFFFCWSYNVSYVSSHLFLHTSNKFTETNN